MGAGGRMAGLSATSICRMRRDPEMLPRAGSTPSDVTSHTGRMSVGCVRQVPLVMTDSFVPSQQTWAPTGLVESTDWPSSPMRFCLFVTLTHLKGMALAWPVLGMLPAGSVGTVKYADEPGSSPVWAQATLAV